MSPLFDVLNEGNISMIDGLGRDLRWFGHSRSFEMTLLGVCKSLLIFHRNHVCISYSFWDIQRQRI